MNSLCVVSLFNVLYTVYVRVMKPWKVEPVPNNVDTFQITTCGRDTLGLDQSYDKSHAFVTFRLNDASKGKTDGSDLVPFEGMLELARRGWVYHRVKGSRKIKSLLPDGEKTWYFNKTVCKYYLRVLLISGKLFSLGLKEIFHFQPAAYYKTLLLLSRVNATMLNTVRPWQTRSYYVLLQQQAGSKVQPRSRDQSEFEFEVEKSQGR